jgi:DNA-cytosine methyltransferase
MKNILALFDGISCGQVALNRAGVAFDTYYSSEIDAKCVEVTTANYPNTVHLGDVTQWKSWDISDIDLIMGGSPCQGFSFAGKQLNFNDPRSKLFFTMVDIINHFKPKYFLLENVVMKQSYQDIISQKLGVQPVLINSCDITPQNRRRLYWTNIPGFSAGPTPTNPILSTVLLPPSKVDPKYLITPAHQKRIDNSEDVKKGFTKVDPTKAVCMTARQFANWKGTYITTPKGLRKLTPVECERLQTLPDDYTSAVADCHRYRALGNGWTVDVISHIFSLIP